MHCRAAQLGAMVLCLGLQSGCGWGARVAAENDRLRVRVMELEKQVADLEGHRVELSAALDEARAKPGDPGAEVLEATPRPASLAIGRLSHAEDNDDDGHPDALVVLVQPSDGRGRFIQLVGNLTVHACELPADAECSTLGRVTLGPEALRDAYRSTLFGTHYTVRLAVSLDDPVPADCTVRAIFVDGYTGRELAANGTIDLHNVRLARASEADPG